MRKWLWPRCRFLLFLAVGMIAIGAVTQWVSYRAWKRALRESGFADEIAPPGREERILIVAPHPDDELLGCGGLIQVALAAGAEVHVVLMTNGDASELSLIFSEREPPWAPGAFVNLGRQRQQESLRALSGLGVPPHHVHFLGFPNNGLLALWRPEHWPHSQLYPSPYTKTSYSPYEQSFTPQAPYCGQQVLSDLMAVLHQVQPTLLFVTHPQDVHPDHWVTGSFVRYALATVAARGAEWARETEVYGYLIHWPHYPVPRRSAPKLGLLPPADLAGPEGTWLRLPLSPEQTRGKLRGINAYRSQEPSFDRLLRAFARVNESFERLPRVELEADRPHEWRDENSRRHGLGGAEVTGLRLTVSDHGAINVELTSASQPLSPTAYLGLDLRSWDRHGTPLLITCYVKANGQVQAVQLEDATLQNLSVEVKRLEPGHLEITGLSLPLNELAQPETFVTCWGSVRDRVTDPVVTGWLRFHPPEDSLSE